VQTDIKDFPTVILRKNIAPKCEFRFWRPDKNGEVKLDLSESNFLSEEITSVTARLKADL